MISKVQIKNFRQHKKLEVELSPGVTTLIGDSAIGKSNMIRSILWTVMNKPAGDKMINWYADSAIVRITVDGKKVVRKKGKIRNVYKLSGKEFKAFGNSVPSEITELFNLSNTNFQNQFKYHFWFDLTAGEVSRQLNSIVNLEIIDSTLANIASIIRSDNSEIQVIESRLKDANIKVEELSYVDDMNKGFQTIESLQNDISENAVGLVLLRKLYESGSKYRLIVKNARDQVLLGKIAIEKEVQYRKITESVENLSNLLKSGRRHVKIIKNKPPDIKPLKKLLSDYEVLGDNIIELKKLLKSFYDYYGKIETWELKKQKIERQIKSLGIKFCKECGQPIKS